MRLLEYQSKRLLKKYGTPVPDGKIVANPSDAKQFMEMAKSDCMLKAQVLTAGRSKSGGIKLIKSVDEIEPALSEMLKIKFENFPVNLTLIEKAVNYKDVFKLSLFIDPVSAKPIIELTYLVSSTEEYLNKHDQSKNIETAEINPEIGLLDYQVRHLEMALEAPREMWDQFRQIARDLWKMFCELDAVYLEINPLVLSSDNHLMALNVIIEIDDYALFRQSELAGLIDYAMYSSLEIETHKAGLSFIQLDGNIGCMANGAALAMSTVDLIYRKGKSPANFLDVGACVSAERLGVGFRLLIAEKNIESMVLNYYGLSTPCDEIAMEILKAWGEIGFTKPVFVLFSGLNSKKGVEILRRKKPFKAALFSNDFSI